MSNTISSWFTPFWYSAASGENTTPEMIKKKREELKAKNELPSFPNPKSLTPAKATAGGVGILGILVAVYGFFKDNSWGKVLGIGAAVLAGVGWFIDKFFVGKADTTNQADKTKTDEPSKAKKPEPEQKNDTHDLTGQIQDRPRTVNLTITNPHQTQILKPQHPTKENVREEFLSILGSSGNIRVASKNLTARDFYKMELPDPAYKISLNGSTYFLSEPFLDETMERPAFILYLATTSEDGSQQLFARGLYKSNSQNIWRVASHTTEYMDWLGKGWGQHTTGLPIEIQSSLANIESELGWKYEQKNHLCDALKKIDSRVPPETFMIRHEDKPKRIGQFTNPTDPTSFKFDNEADKPNFESGIGQIFKNNNPLYGEVTSFIVESHNKELLYLFNLDSEGRAWIGDIQYSYPVLNTYGVKVKPLNIDKKIFTPAYEYGSEIPAGFMGNINPRDRHYYDCSAYTNNIPIIKEFLGKIVAK